MAEYLIYRNHLGDVSDLEAETYRGMVEEALGVPATLVKNVEGVGSGLRLTSGDSEAFSLRLDEERGRAHDVAEQIWSAGGWSRAHPTT